MMLPGYPAAPTVLSFETVTKYILKAKQEEEKLHHLLNICHVCVHVYGECVLRRIFWRQSGTDMKSLLIHT